VNHSALLSTAFVLVLAFSPTLVSAQTSDNTAPAPAEAEGATGVAPAPTGDAAKTAPGETATAPSAASPEVQTGPQAPANGSAVGSVVSGLSPAIQDVQIVGPWTDGDKQGVWRTVIAQPNGDAKSHFFVQQLENTGDDFTVRSTTEIKEISQVDGAILGYRADEPSEADPNSLMLFFEIVPSGAELSETYELRFSPNAPYIFGPATN